jgi:hypothetical protein
MRIKTVLILLPLALAISLPLQSQTVNNATANKVTLRAPTPDELIALDKAGVDTNALPPKLLFPDDGGMPSMPPTAQQEQQAKQLAANPTPPELKNALIYVDNFLGGGKTGFPADVISIKKGVLKFRFGGKDFDYSGNFSIMLTKPRQHKNPYFGLGTPEKAKLLTLGGFFKGEPDETMLLPNATIWEKSDGFIVAVALEKEWIHSGNYTITN